MKEKDLLESISEIDEELLERSERNKQAAVESAEAAQGNMHKQKDNTKHVSFRRRRFFIAASVAIVLCLAGQIVYFALGSGKDSPGVSKLLSPYVVSAAEYPEVMKQPNYMDFDEGNDGVFGPEEMAKYNEAEREYISQRTKLINVDGYSPTLGRTVAQSFNAKAMKQFLSESLHENRVYSPINICIALGMLAETTDGETRQQILDVLGLESIEALRPVMKGLWNGLYKDDKTKCILASSVWLNDKIHYKKDTLDTLASNYYASSFSGDMGSAKYSEAFRTWLDEQTDGILKEQISGLAFDQSTVMALATTVCFNARWGEEFNKDKTKPDTFHSSNGDILCDFMNASGTGLYFWGEKFGAVQKIFGMGEGRMLFILPDEGVSVYDLLEDEQVIDFINKGQSFGQAKTLTVDLSIPKFDISSKNDIIGELKALGITDVYDAEKADFTPLSDKDKIWVDKVEHGVRVIVDEEGVKAAAYTVEKASGADLPPDDYIDFILDRPFMFVISMGDGIPMFVGIVEKPQVTIPGTDTDTDLDYFITDGTTSEIDVNWK